MSRKSKNQKISETIVELVSYIIFLVLFVGVIYPSSPLFALVAILVVTLILIYAVWKSYSDEGSLVEFLFLGRINCSFTSDKNAATTTNFLCLDVSSSKH